MMIKRDRNNIWLSIKISFLLLLCMGGMSDFDRASLATDIMQKCQIEKTLRVGFADEEPFAYVDKQGNLTGEAVVVGMYVLKKLGVERLEGISTEFGSLIPGLKAGRFDMIAAGMYITPKRCKEVCFSNPTYKLGENFLVRSGNPKNLHSYKELMKDNIIVGITAGSVESQYLKIYNIPESRIKIYPSPPLAARAVLTGKIDALAAPSLTVNRIAQKLSGVEAVAHFIQPKVRGKSIIGYGAFAFRKEDAEFVKRINKELKSFIGSKEHLKLVSSFGFDDKNIPDKTASELCDRKW